MNKKIILTTIATFIIVLALSACGGSSEETGSDESINESSIVESLGEESSSNENPGPVIGEDFQDALPISSQLGFGTFLLEGSKYAVDPEQATELLPLWKILHLVGADWTYGSKGWAGENYCMFLADDESWEKVTRTTTGQAEPLAEEVDHGPIIAQDHQQEQDIGHRQPDPGDGPPDSRQYPARQRGFAHDLDLRIG